MKTQLTILAAILLLGCAKQDKEPNKYLSVSVTEDAIIRTFTLNGVKVSSPVLVKSGDIAHIYAFGSYPRYGILTISIDGQVQQTANLRFTVYDKDFVVP